MNKADKLNLLATKGINVAQFISVTKDSVDVPEYFHIHKKEFSGHTTKDLIIELINSSISGEINIRSFSKDVTKGNRFVMGKGIEDIEEVLGILKENSDKGLDSIINENIDVSDGGVSGVVMGDIIEFSPDDTPRCVEKEGVCSLPREIGISILEKVYGFRPKLDYGREYRVEFSVHPLRQGVEKENTIIWEYEKVNQNVEPQISFPDNFSKHIGDKVFGLLILDSLGLPVPYSTVISRKVAPFHFGKPTGSSEKWLRTAPIVKEAGKYTTCKGWVDPFKLMSVEDANHESIGSIISQDSVEAKYSGASIIRSSAREDIIEGTSGHGDDFMVGEKNGVEIPESVITEIRKTHEQIRQHRDLIGDVSIEWAYDGDTVWVVQLNQIRSLAGSSNVIVDEDRDITEYLVYDVRDGLEPLRQLIDELNDETGIELIGNIGITSHLGDVLRQTNTPSFITRI